MNLVFEIQNIDQLNHPLNFHIYLIMKVIQIYYNIFYLTKITHYFNLLNLYSLILPFYLKS